MTHYGLLVKDVVSQDVSARKVTEPRAENPGLGTRTKVHVRGPGTGNQLGEAKVQVPVT